MARVRRIVRTAATVLGGVVAAGLAVTLGAGACVPDLVESTLPSADSGMGLRGCGDGFVDLDAGEQCDPGPGEAGAIGCTSRCTVDCPDGGFVDDASMHCYFAPGAAQLTFDSAKQACGQGAHLVNFASEGEFSTVFAWGLQTGAPFWIGLAQFGGVWIDLQPPPDPGFVSGCTGCFAHADDAGVFAHPDAAAGQCLATGATEPSRWIAAGCTSGRHVVCEREPVGTLIEQCNGLQCMRLRATMGRKRYIYVDQPSSSNDAAAFCAGFPSGRLVVLQSREERDQLWHELVQLATPPLEVWIGLARDEDAGVWRWDDGADEKAYPSEWGASQPIGAGDYGGARGYLWLNLGDPEPDSQLARNADQDPETKLANAPTALPFVCEAAP